MTPSAPSIGSPATFTGRALRLIFSLIVTAAVVVVAAPGREASGTAAGARERGRGIQASEHPVLPIGSPLPDFSLPGVDGKTHKSSEYHGVQGAGRRLREQPLPGLAALRGPDREALRGLSHARASRSSRSIRTMPKAVRLNELGYTDVTDSLPEMKIRAAFRGIDWPYLYDGETQALVDEVRRRRHAAHLPLRPGAQAALPGPHRRQPARGAGQDARRARTRSTRCSRAGPSPVAETRAFGCTTKWMSKSPGRRAGVGED